MNLEDKLEFVDMKERTIPGRGSNVLQIYFEAWGRAPASAKRGRLWSTRLAQGYSLCPVSDWWRGQRPGPLPHPAPHLELDHLSPRTPQRISWGGCCSTAQTLPLPSPAPFSPVHPSNLSITSSSQSLFLGNLAWGSEIWSKNSRVGVRHATFKLSLPLTDYVTAAMSWASVSYL